MNRVLCQAIRVVSTRSSPADSTSETIFDPRRSTYRPDSRRHFRRKTGQNVQGAMEPDRRGITGMRNRLAALSAIVVSTYFDALPPWADAFFASAPVGEPICSTTEVGDGILRKVLRPLSPRRARGLFAFQPLAAPESKGRSLPDRMRGIVLAPTTPTRSTRSSQSTRCPRLSCQAESMVGVRGNDVYWDKYVF